MRSSVNTEPELVIEYTDPVEGFKGWLVIDSMAHTLCAGGLRVQKGLTCDTIRRLAANMTLKMRIAGIRADGAKSGIAYDPASPGKEEALFRFIRAIKPYILQRYSMGPDMNTTMPELDTICNRLGMSSIKTAVAAAQNLDADAFKQRISLLKKQAGPAALGRLRAGIGLAAAAQAALEFQNIPLSGGTVVIQGFGGLAASAAHFLSRAGVKIIGIADREKSLISTDGSPLPISSLLSRSVDGILPRNDENGHYGKREEIYDVSCDVFIPAAVEKTVHEQNAGTMQVGAIVCGANLAVLPAAEQTLYKRGILLIPDMIAGCGGSLSMEGLFAPVSMPTVEDVLAHVENKTRSIVKTMLKRSRQDGIPPREAALRICAETPLYPGTRPYGPLVDRTPTL
jgi:glutamate dehydrogenase (NAD(P)+)